MYLDRLFQRVTLSEKFILILDELDLIAKKRFPEHDKEMNESEGRKKLIVAECLIAYYYLLQCLDLLETKKVFVLGICKSKEALDSDIVGPGRLSISFLVETNTPRQRFDILNIVCKSNRCFTKMFLLKIKY
jgi:SpoVK/Ycf46/Vps4 family AAA+-type ATPase